MTQRITAKVDLKPAYNSPKATVRRGGVGLGAGFDGDRRSMFHAALPIVQMVAMTLTTFAAQFSKELY